MKFKEQFPSLKKKIWNFVVINAKTSFHDVKLAKNEKFVLVKDFKENCLDKQKVREVIDKLFKTEYQKKNPEQEIARLKMELGL